MTAISMKDLRKSYGTLEVIHGIDIDVESGEFVALVGPSGCGKSTLLRMISGLEPISAGQMSFDDQRVNDLSPAERQIAMVFQSYALYPHMSVRKNLSFGLENLRMDRAEINRRVEAAARMLAIDGYLDRRPKALSGGQRQRVAIGRAIVRQPRVFLFDEPLSNLDAKLRVQTRSEITKLHKQLKTTMIYVTHDQVEAMTMAQKIVVLNKGKVEQIGRPLDLFERPANLFVAGFIGSPRMNIYPGKVVSADGTGVTVESAHLGRFTLPHAIAGIEAEGDIVIGLRPSHLKLGAAEPGAGGGTMTVEQVESMGHETFVYGRTSQSEDLTIVHVPGHFEAEMGTSLAFTFDPAFAHLFSAVSGRSLKEART
ncbi:sn-glycerol-3-phosphate ABC transporter ATP-binding protein UgpC [Rhizobium giardinii]|uniref:ABC transporter ATP-binding protein n=1 Tax=Rhizobium giardinii TaxID=56731 RepID=UPI000DD8590C